MGIFLRIAKAAFMFGLMYLSLRYLGFPVSASLAFSLVPLVLGTINVLPGIAYGLTAVVFMFACATALFPDWQRRGKELMQSLEQARPQELKEAVRK